MNLESVYKSEIEQFQHAVLLSEKILETADSISIDQISDKVGKREDIITKIKSLEAIKKKRTAEENNTRYDKYREKISELAGKLVEIDAKIYKKLQDKKIKLVQKYSSSADSNYSRTKVFEQEKTSKIVDIRQE